MRRRARESSTRRGPHGAWLAPCSAALALLTTLVTGRPAAAHEPGSGTPAPLELRVRYTAPAGCPSGVDFLAALHAHLAEGGVGPVAADVSITGPTGGMFELELRLQVAGATSLSRARAESCSALMQLAALDASMARTPSPLEASATPVVFEPDAPSPPLAAAQAPASPPLHDDAVPAEPSAAEPASPPLRGFVLGETRTVSGMLPGAAWGPGVALGISHAPWSLRLSGTWWLPEDYVYGGDGGSPITLRFEQQSLELAPCAGHALSRWLQLEACAALSAHRTQTSAGERDVWAALGGSLLAVLHPWRGLRVEAAAQLLVPFSPPHFAVQTLEDVYQAQPLQPGARLALGWEFGSVPPSPTAPPAPPAFDRSSEARAARLP